MAAVLAVGWASASLSPASASEVVAGSGMASAVVARVGPVGDNLSFVVAWGESLADHQGSSARGQSAVADLGLLGFFLTTPICPHQPPPVDKKYLPAMTRTGSDDKGSSDGKHTTFAAAPAGPIQSSAGDEWAWATKDPSARAATTLAAIGAPGAIEIVGGRSDVHTGATGTGRDSAATSQVASLDVLGGLLHLEGLRWNVDQHSDRNGSVDRTVGSFRLNRASVAGHEVPLDPGAPPAVQLAAVNGALGPSGLGLVAPVVTVKDGVVAVTPLGLRMTDSPAARSTIAPVVSALQPVRQPVADALAHQSCSAALGIEAFDVIADSMAGNGGMVVELGGAVATTEGNRFASPFLDIPPATNAVPPAAVSEPTAVTTAAPTARATSRTSPLQGLPSSIATRRMNGRLAGGSHTVPGAAGGIAAVAALASVAVVLGLAAGDRRRIRRIRRSGAV